jgi:hypothetical protein
MILTDDYILYCANDLDRRLHFILCQWSWPTITFYIVSMILTDDYILYCANDLDRRLHFILCQWSWPTITFYIVPMILIRIYCLNIYSNMTSFFRFGLERYEYILSLASTRRPMLKLTRVCDMLSISSLVLSAPVFEFYFVSESSSLVKHIFRCGYSVFML